MEGVGGGLRMERGARREGGESRPQSLDARPGLRLRFIHSAEVSVLLQTGCNADSPGCTHAGHRSPVCPVCPDRLVHLARQARRGGPLPGLHLFAKCFFNGDFLSCSVIYVFGCKPYIAAQNLKNRTLTKIH